ncbi:MAG: ornithine carbamoyltransferase [SAR202 cluster bacterium]|nr:ornithine carbamoyltransferase [SAR202 cluster bacterium]
MPTDLLSMNDLTDGDVRDLLDAAALYKRRAVSGAPLGGKSVVLLFEKPSLRTKVSFDIAVAELGGHPIYLGRDEVGLDKREPVEDVAQILSRWAGAIVARVFAHRSLVRLASAATVPVINALSDLEHPCQALADVLTIRERFGKLDDVSVAYVGDANNCALSLALACAATGANFRIASPSGYGFSAEAIGAISSRFQHRRDAIADHGQDPAAAVRGADVVYTDVWTSMGQEEEAQLRRADFQDFQVNEALLAKAKPTAILMHPMPAHYGEEVPAGMLAQHQSAAIDQAENRLHAQKAVLRLLVAGE